MRNIKRVLLPAIVGLMGIAFMAPASAWGQGELIHATTGETVAPGTEIDLTGQFEITSLGTGIGCDVHATITANTATTGSIEFEITTPSCEGFGFLYSGCDLVEDETAEWHVDVETTDLAITNVEMFIGLENCESGLTFSDLTAERLTLVPETFGRHGGITAFELKGEGETHADPGTLGVEAHATLKVVGDDADTFRIVEE